MVPLFCVWQTQLRTGKAVLDCFFSEVEAASAVYSSPCSRPRGCSRQRGKRGRCPYERDESTGMLELMHLNECILQMNIPDAHSLLFRCLLL